MAFFWYSQPSSRQTDRHSYPTSIDDMLKVLLQSNGDSLHGVTRVAMLREEEGEFMIGILLQLNISWVKLLVNVSVD